MLEHAFILGSDFKMYEILIQNVWFIEDVKLDSLTKKILIVNTKLHTYQFYKCLENQTYLIYCARKELIETLQLH